MRVIIVNTETSKPVFHIEAPDINPTVGDIFVLPNGDAYRIVQRAHIVARVANPDGTISIGNEMTVGVTLECAAQPVSLQKAGVKQ